jgi:transposase-like protein
LLAKALVRHVLQAEMTAHHGHGKNELVVFIRDGAIHDERDGSEKKITVPRKPA